ncbi:hypothetical protein FQR65_LT00317 [Abscondita terminalis]|nr:hypothetical protein FQR65_LT00317 [Abscondita terminalis]
MQKRQRVVAPKGHRNLCKVTSGEKWVLCTTCFNISAAGQAPPIITYPRKNVIPKMAIGTPPLGKRLRMDEHRVVCQCDGLFHQTNSEKKRSVLEISLVTNDNLPHVNTNPTPAVLNPSPAVPDIDSAGLSNSETVLINSRQ